jgi:hypothetical protein
VKPSFSSSLFERPKRWLMRFPAMAYLGRLSRQARTHFLARNRGGAFLRLFVTAVAFAAYWFLIVVAQGFPGELDPELQNELGPIGFLLLNILTPFFQPEVLVYILPVIAAAMFGLYVAARYLADLFDTESVWTAYRYLVGAILGLNYPVLRVDQGNLETLEAENAENPVILIGGPGYVDVHLGFAAVFESENGYPRVLSAQQREEAAIPDVFARGDRHIEGFTRLRDVVDLRDRHSQLDEIMAVTRDGIEVYARDVQVVFRVYSGEQKRTLENPYPFDERSVRRLVYGQPVTRKGTSRWESVLPSIVKREIRDFVAQRKVEEFLAMQPFRILENEAQIAEADAGEDGAADSAATRRDLTERFHTEERKARLRDHGLESTWVGVGAWEVRGSHPGEDIGPGKTLLTAWRDLQLARRLNSKRYLQRKGHEAFQDVVSDSVSHLIRSWKAHQLRRSDRCFEFLNTYRQVLLEIQQRLERNPEQDGRIQTILLHLDKLIGPTVFGGPDY